MNGEKGSSLVETLVAVALLGVIGVSLLCGVNCAYNALIVTDEQDIGKNLAQSQMENTMKAEYAMSYPAAPIPDVYQYYTADIDTDSFRDSNIQKITVTIMHQGKEVSKLEGYKVHR